MPNLWVDQVEILGMGHDEARDERAEWDNRQSTCPRTIERCPCECRSDTVALDL